MGSPPWVEPWNLAARRDRHQYHFHFATFQEAARFVHLEVGKLVEQSGYSPQVRIDGSDVVLTLGLEMPQILTEGDFDFAEALDGSGEEEDDNEPEPPAAEA